jgi:alpha-mannosidase/mannosylglycerate hydrolase
MPRKAAAPTTTRPAGRPKTSQRPLFWVVSTHWDREWYEPFQGFRYRLVNLLDEVLDTLERDGRFSHFQMDGQSIPIEDYLEVRPEEAGRVRALASAGKLAIGPWYVLPDEFIVSGESIVRNLQLGLQVAGRFGTPSRAGFVCDIFGHNSQLPQIFAGFGIGAAFVWRGINEAETGANFLWRGADGTELPAYRFGPIVGYCDGSINMRQPQRYAEIATLDGMVDSTDAYLEKVAGRVPPGVPLLIFDGSDHLEIEPQTGALLEKLAPLAAKRGLQLQMGTLDDYSAALSAAAGRLRKVVIGELRNPSGRPGDGDEQWLIPGVLSSRMPLKQANARCESVLTQWAEPWSAFATRAGLRHPQGFLDVAWKSLLTNHAHDSICGCSPDQIHKDMEFRFDQTELIGERVKRAALEHLAYGAARPLRAAPGTLEQLVLLANPTSEPIEEPVTFTVSLPNDSPVWNEFFGFERKPGFWLSDAQGGRIAYQRLAQNAEQIENFWSRRKLPEAGHRWHVTVAATVKIPAYGYTTLGVEPATGPTRHPEAGNGGPSLATSATSAENEMLALQWRSGGRLEVADKRNGQVYRNLLTMEDCADIGDGWYHGQAVNEAVHSSVGCAANVALIQAGPQVATFRAEVRWPLPARFDFGAMRRSAEMRELIITHTVTLRAGASRVEVRTELENSVRDHRLRVLCPSGLNVEEYWADTPFDAVRRPVGLDPEGHAWRELPVETTPQQSWTAVMKGGRGLAIVSRGLPESCVAKQAGRPLALTLFRSTKKTVFTNGEEGGQLLRPLSFDYWLVPLAGRGDVPDAAQLARLGQRLAAGIGSAYVELKKHERRGEYMTEAAQTVELPREQSYLQIGGNVVASMLRQNSAGQWVVRVFNPAGRTAQCRISAAEPIRKAWQTNLEETADTPLRLERGALKLTLKPKEIVTLKLG